MHTQLRILLSILLLTFLAPLTHAATGHCTSHSTKPIPQRLSPLADPNYHPNLDDSPPAVYAQPKYKRSTDPSYLLPSRNPPRTSSNDPQVRALASCLTEYRARNWGTWRCGGYEWYKRGDGYYGGGASQCTNACTCLNDAVNGGLTDAECLDETGAFAAGGTCWMGYRPLIAGENIS